MTTTFETERMRRPDFYWVVPLGGFLIIVGLTLSQYPDIFSMVGDYFRVLSETGKASMPPLRLGEAIIFFFTVAGAWGLFAAALRFVFGHSGSRAVGDIMGSFFAFLIAYPVYSYYHAGLSAAAILPLIIVGLGVVVIVNAIASHARYRLLTPAGRI